MVSIDERGLACFRIFLADARSVSLCGSFTGWERHPIPMAPEGDGWWRVRAALPPGEHAFLYHVDHDRWEADFAAFGVRINDYGLWESRLLISASPSNPRGRPGWGRMTRTLLEAETPEPLRRAA